MKPQRIARVERRTKETRIVCQVDLDGTGTRAVSTGIGFLDHMLEAFAAHSRIDLELECTGDLHIDDHHTAEDCALTLGAALDEALGERTEITRFGEATVPLDEALVRCVIDLSGRPFTDVDLAFRREALGGIATENVTHFFRSLGVALRMTLHVDQLKGENDHHKAEAAFKACARALRTAVALDPSRDGVAAVPSTKGVL
ncbi:MAG: imidazoleglycerol-phosphate dehydratase HisB [Planctomycetota bacterium]|jgi:imidazoleglycerol phosphate dehydratase HisB